MMKELKGRNLHYRHFPLSGPHPLGSFSWPPRDFEGDVGCPAGFLDPFMGEATVAPDQGQAGVPPGRISNDRGTAIPLLNGGCLDLDGDRQTEGVDYDEPFPPFDLLARVEPAEPPFSVVLTDWLSTAPALASGSRWARSRHRPCRRS